MKKEKISDTKIITSIREMIEVMQIKVKNNIIEKSRELDISRKDLSTLAEVIDSTMMNSFSDSVEYTVSKIKS